MKLTEITHAKVNSRFHVIILLETWLSHEFIEGKIKFHSYVFRCDRSALSSSKSRGEGYR